jgi:FtsZ-interacting cell division protein ZipA
MRTVLIIIGAAVVAYLIVKGFQAVRAERKTSQENKKLK